MKMCPECMNRTLVTTKRDDKIITYCEHCGYKKIKNVPLRGSDNNFFNVLVDNKFLIVLLLFVVLMMIVISSVNSRVDETNVRLNYLISDMEESIFDINNTTSTMISDLNDDLESIEGDIGSAFSKISDLEEDISSLNSIANSVITLGSDLDDVKENVSLLWVEIFSTSQENIIELLDTNCTMSYFVNQSNATDERYCHLNFSLSSSEINVQEIIFLTRCDNVSFTLMNYTGYPEFYNWTNDEYNDNYRLHWFGPNLDVFVSYNITWNISDYNTSKLSFSNIKNVLEVNNVFVDTFEVWEVSYD